MGQRGPQKQPTGLRLLRGETRPSQVGRGDPVPRPAEPEPPSWFGAVHRAAWERITAELRPMHLLHSADRDALVALVVAVVIQEDAAREVAEHGLLVEGRDGGRVRNPAQLVLASASADVRRLGREFGLTPSGRADLGRGPWWRPGDGTGPERLLT